MIKLLQAISQFCIVAAVVAGSLLVECCRIVSNWQSCVLLAQYSIPLLLIVGFILLDSTYKYTAEVKERIGVVVDIVSKPTPTRPLSVIRKQKTDVDFYDADSFDDLDLSEAASTNGHSHDSIDWESLPPAHISAHTAMEETLAQSVTDPRVLIGWKISLNNDKVHGIILSTIKRPFATTKFAVQCSNGKVYILKLKRSENKGKVPFKLIEKVNE